MKIDFAMTDFGQEEIDAVNRVMQTSWLASGTENESFEKEFAEYVGAKYAVCVNSGSSANLLAIASLQLSRDAKIVTSACGFPATLSPILHLGYNPRLVDYSMDSFNVDIEGIIQYIPHISAIIFAHTLGNPVDVIRIKREADKYGVKIIEDCCEAVGTTIYGKHVGTFGDIGTYSFYPAHQMTALGGGGMVVTSDFEIYKSLKSMRDWGKMYDWDSSYGGVNTDYSSPIGYHRGYTYDTIGWNFKLPEANAAFGRVQLKRLSGFKDTRLRNWFYLYSHLRDIPNIKIAPMAEGSSPFGFCMTVENRNEFGAYLESKGIKHRPFFAGNITRQPAFKELGPVDFPVADKLMRYALFIGTHTKLTEENLSYMVEVISAYFGNPELQRNGHASEFDKLSPEPVQKAG